MKVLYIGNHAGYFLTHRLPIAGALLDAGYEVHVAVPDSPDELEKLITQDAIQEIQSLGFIFHALPFNRSGVNPFLELQTLFRIGQLYNQIKPDLVYMATIKPVIYGGFLARLMRLPAVVYSITGLGYVFTIKGVKVFFLRGGVKLAYRFVAGHSNSYMLVQNTDDQQQLINAHIVPPEKIVVVKGSGVDSRVFNITPEPEGEIVVLLPSRMIWDKGVLEFVEAARILKSHGIRGQFRIAGDSDPSNPRAVPREQLQKWHDEGIIEWMGWIKNMPDILQQSHVVCLPTYYREGIPKALIEAACSGRPLVVADVAGCREVVHEGVNGYLVPPRDSATLAEAIKLLIDDPVLRREMGKCSREIAEKEFTSEIIVSQVLDLCNKLLEAGNRS